MLDYMTHILAPEGNRGVIHSIGVTPITQVT